VYDRVYATYPPNEQDPRSMCFALRRRRLHALSSDTSLQVDVEKCYVVAEAGITLVDLQQQIAMYGLAMHNLGSISTQALGGVISTATHGTGINFKVLPADVMALTVLLANGELVACSREERSDLFFATLSGWAARA
jgi:L-gulonolactone oxidase